MAISLRYSSSGLSSCEAKRSHALHVTQLLSTCRQAKQSHALHVTQLLSTCRLENPPHVQGRVESCPISVRDKAESASLTGATTKKSSTSASGAVEPTASVSPILASSLALNKIKTRSGPLPQESLFGFRGNKGSTLGSSNLSRLGVGDQSLGSGSGGRRRIPS
ncbi:hypothetical protein ACFX1T_036323 [Malus domestica]